ncbi:hypothetical protein VFPPC_16573 [Pochonia chlamydosporia 170]|uniref:Uncharacterized protein n=1 Tax=Pochonia chlamydosporia 170 TaxID=1380566 RepID=A0A179F914_METCM|nr:hypothetical protein VFPPC_16573 [Pochonia chlamydosporia 170]OAQ61877.1 hypothetical protein VFPPC_16573 [Pochonia chlamydosporia 170]
MTPIVPQHSLFLARMSQVYHLSLANYANRANAGDESNEFDNVISADFVNQRYMRPSDKSLHAMATTRMGRTKYIFIAIEPNRRVEHGT